MKLEEAVVTKPALFVVTVKNDVWSLLATLVKPPLAAFTVRHRFFTILWQMAVTMELYFFHSAHFLNLQVKMAGFRVHAISLRMTGFRAHALRGDCPSQGGTGYGRN